VPQELGWQGSMGVAWGPVREKVLRPGHLGWDLWPYTHGVLIPILWWCRGSEEYDAHSEYRYLL